MLLKIAKMGVIKFANSCKNRGICPHTLLLMLKIFPFPLEHNGYLFI